MTEMQAEFAALTAEASEWDDTAEALSTAASTAAGLTVTASSFSFISQMTDVESTYQAAQQHVVDVCTAGQRETHKLAEALRQVRSDFQSTDSDVVDRVTSIWIPE